MNEDVDHILDQFAARYIHQPARSIDHQGATLMALQMLHHGLDELNQLMLHVHQQQAALLTLLLLCPLLVLLLVRRRCSSTATARSREQLLSKLPSPPGRLPIIGHLHLIGPLPHVTLRDLDAKHGRDGLLLLRLGAVPTLVVSSPSAAQAVLRTHDHVFASRAYSPITDVIFYGSTDSAFAPYGEHWRQVKKITTTHLLTNKKVRSYRRSREKEVSMAISKIREVATGGTAAAAVDLSDLLRTFSNNIVCHAVSGQIFEDEGQNKLLQELVDANSRLIGGFHLLDYFPALGRLGVLKRMLCNKAHKVNKAWDDLLGKLIDEHARKLASQQRDGDDDEGDFIDVLLSVQQEYKLTMDHIKAQLVVTFEAATDTTSLVLEYAMARLIQNPQAMAKLQAEVRTAVPKGKLLFTEDDLHGMHYLRAVIKEILRLHAPAPLLLPHLSMADCIIEGHTVPSGTRTIINSWALSRDPRQWDRADEFVPERFVDGGAAAAVDYVGNDFLLLPFGSGRRRCPGISFAMTVVEVMLANLVYHFDWKLPPELVEKGIDMTESFGVTLHRTQDLLLVPVLPND